MLKKLMKHDFRALSRTLFPLQIGVLGGGLVATLLTALTIRLGQNTASTGGSALFRQLVMGVSATASVLIGIAIIASALITLLLICYHFYRSFLGDEGYLTFTLPVSTSKLIWSKLLTGMIWTFQFTPATPKPLLPLAPMMPATCVPWPLRSIGSLGT